MQFTSICCCQIIRILEKMPVRLQKAELLILKKDRWSCVSVLGCLQGQLNRSLPLSDTNKNRETSKLATIIRKYCFILASDSYAVGGLKVGLHNIMTINLHLGINQSERKLCSCFRCKLISC